MNNPLPTGKFKRSQIAGIAVAKAGAKQLGHLSKRPFLSKESWKKKQELLHEENAEALFRVLCQLRGTALKLAQMLAMETDLLPKEFHQELGKSYHQVPPLNRALVRKVVRFELGESPEKLFTSFETTAFAAASLGQVHRATLEDIGDLAVKLQYPGIGATIDSDLQLLRGFLKGIPKGKMALSLLDELKDRLQEEIDYQREQDQIQWFQENLTIDQVKIPRVFSNVSSQRILSMEYLQGKHLTEWLKGGPSQKERNHFAQLMYDTYLFSLFKLNRIHADPNPGNYLFQKSGTLGLIDFGCIKQFSPEFTKNLRKLYQYITEGDHSNIMDIYVELGMLSSEIDYDSHGFVQEAIMPFHEWCREPLKEESFDFAANSGYSAKALKLMRNFHRFSSKAADFMKPNPNFLFTDRTTYGLYKIFEQMGATVKMRDRWNYLSHPS